LYETWNMHYVEIMYLCLFYGLYGHRFCVANNMDLDEWDVSNLVQQKEHLWWVQINCFWLCVVWIALKRYINICNEMDYWLPPHFCWRKCIVRTLKEDYSVQYLNRWYDFMNCSHPFIHHWVYSPLLGPGRFFSFIIPYTVGLLGQGISLSQGHYVYTEHHEHRTNTQTSMPQVGFEPTTPLFKQAKTVHSLDRAATEIGL
jgi:hypothetical protein